MSPAHGSIGNDITYNVDLCCHPRTIVSGLFAPMCTGVVWLSVA